MKPGLTMFLLFFFVLPAISATPPQLLNYQGVLRDSSGAPLTGSYDLIFRFWSAVAAGDEILVDSHLVSGSGAVVVTGGLFNAALGAGAITDGVGPGTYTSLASVFRDYSAVYLEVQVGAETLAPRTRIVSAAYSLNAAHIDGKSSSEILDTSSAAQTKSGELTVDSGSIPSSTAVTGLGALAGGFFRNLNGTGRATVAVGHEGITAVGNIMGGFFLDLDNSGFAYVASGDTGIEAYGHAMGGWFQDSDGSGYARTGVGDRGIEGYGNQAGGYFKSLLGSGIANVGIGDYGITAFGNTSGGFFRDPDNSGYASVGVGDRGIEGYGNEMGGYFKNPLGSSYANVGLRYTGIEGYGAIKGGYFENLATSSNASVGYGGYGVLGFGSSVGGQFQELDGSGYANVGSGDHGIEGFGNLAGGYFKALIGTGYANVGIGDYGIQGFGNSAGGYFQDLDGSAYANVGFGDTGIDALGNFAGGFFKDRDSSGQALLGWGDAGIYAFGTGAGGAFTDSDSAGSANVGVNTYKILGNGSVAFAQNHPTEKDKVIVYNAPEGDEVATYTRGTARLVNGEAHIPLGETFAWVTNPDLGLTAYITPREQAIPLAIVSLTTRQLVVRGPAHGPQDTGFDYIVYGLRIGFEDVSIVQEKQTESYIPAMTEHRERYVRHPELARFSALERFKTMTASVRPTEALDQSGAAALKAAVHEYDPASDGPVENLMGYEATRLPEPAKPGESPLRVEPVVIGPSPTPPPAPPERRLVEGLPHAPAVPMVPETGAAPGNGSSAEKTIRRQPSAPSYTATSMSVAGPAGPGDVVVLDAASAGAVMRATAAADHSVVGIIIGEPRVDVDPPEVDVAVSGVVSCRVDASYGAIRPGDLLTSSATPGYAMRAVEPGPGAVLGKALEPLEVGTGTIKVLVMPR